MNAEPTDDLRSFLAVLWRPGDVREVRIPGPGRTDAGYFDSPDALAHAVEAVDGRQNVYVTVNPVDPALLARAANRIKARVRATTSDANITERRWLPIDIDPQRPSDISATEAEREAALEVTRRVWTYLDGLGWPEPVTAMSGNGYWLLYPVELPNDPESKRVVDGVLAHLAGRFDTAQVSIDTTVSNAARIVALIGTLKVKGDPTKDRPHRRSGLVREPAELVPVPVHLLAELAPPAPPAAAPGPIVVTGDRMPAGWVGKLLDERAIAYRPGTRNERTWYRLASCPFHPDDDQGGDCGVGEDEAGKGLGHCFHNRGAGKGWRDFKAALGLATAPTPAASVAAAAKPPRVAGARMDAADLLALDLAPIRWIVPGLIPEGTTILAAPPKVGKSCLVYQIAVEASIGGDVLGRRVTPGSVLYLALEDGRRRGQQRLLAALAGRTMPRGRLEVQWEARPIGAGLEDDIREWLDGHPDAVMVAIDTLGKVRPASDGRRNAYEVDVAAMNELQNLFRDRPVGLVIVHHARKESTDDFLASVSGTYGITGSADTVVVIRRLRNESFGTIHVTGRDVADEQIPARFDELTWTAAPGALSAASFERTEVYRVIEDRGPVFAKSVADELGMERTAVQHVIGGLVEKGAVARVRGGYVVAAVVLESDEPHAGVHSSVHSDRPIPLSLPLHSTHSQSEQSEGSEGSEGGHAREDVRRPQDLFVDCDAYRDHQTRHFYTTAGWRCGICSPEDAA
jgi:biotin operon repressor